MKSKLNPGAFIANKKSQKTWQFFFFLNGPFESEAFSQSSYQELSCLEKLHWTVFPFHLCFSVFLLFGLFILE